MPNLVPRPSLEQLQKQAKELLRQFRAGDKSAAGRLQKVNPRLADAQFVVAREAGFGSWAKLKHHIASAQPPSRSQFEQLAQKLAAAYTAGDFTAIREINFSRGTTFFSNRKPERMQERLATWFASETRTADLALADVRLMVARAWESESWDALMDRTSAANLGSAQPPVYSIDATENIIEPGAMLFDRDWDAIFEVMKERGITGLRAGGKMTDAALERLSRLDQLTRLDLGNCIQLTDSGLASLARLPNLQELDISGWKGRITDRGLEVLRHLKALKRFQICWQQHVSDAGLKNLAFCEHLESVNLLGTPAGDDVIRALTGKPMLRNLRTGSGVTDAGLELFHQFPAFKKWQGGSIRYELMSADAGPTHLLLDGPFTDAGLRKLAGLNGLFGLTFFWHCPAFTSAGLAPLKDLPHLGFLGCQDEHCDDEAMRHIAAIPKLRMLMGQGAVASDAGFKALSRSKTIEYIWGRECPNLSGRGFSALANMPALRGLAVSCKNVDDKALSKLPDFQSLRELVPMEASDEGFRHVGRCANLEALWCMYCQETGDAATEQLAGLKKLKSYYAGSTRITERSLAILARMPSLERIELHHVAGLSSAGVGMLAALPRLREISLDGLPGVTRDVAALFPARVRVRYSV